MAGGFAVSDPVGGWFGAVGWSGNISVSLIVTLWFGDCVGRAARHLLGKVGTGLPLQQMLKIDRHQVGFRRQSDHGEITRQATEIGKQIPKILNCT